MSASKPSVTTKEEFCFLLHLAVPELHRDADAIRQWTNPWRQARYRICKELGLAAEFDVDLTLCGLGSDTVVPTDSEFYAWLEAHSNDKG